MKKTEIPVNNALLNLIAPMGLTIKRNSLIIGENSAKVYGIVKYPPNIDYGWLSKITNIPGTIVSMSFTPIANGGFVEALNKNISMNRGKANDARDALAKQRATKAADDGEKLLLQIDQNGETVGTLGITIMPVAQEEEVFRKVERKVISSCAAAQCKIRLLACLQALGFAQIAPMYTVNEKVEKIIDRIVPLSAVVGGFPNSSSGYNDGSGYYVAKDTTGGLIVLDMWKRGGDRTNSNIVIMGVPGTGKSTAIKSIITSERMKGTRIILIDPEGEYKNLCLSLGGDWINAGGSLKGRINPLQVRPIPRNEEEKDLYEINDGNGMSELALYIKHLDVFFALYVPGITDRQKAILKSCLIELYHNFNINWNTNIKEMTAEQFPIMEDLYKLLLEKEKEYEKVRRESDENSYQELAILLKDIAVGADSFLWNGHTTLKSKAPIVCLDTSSLQDSGDNVKCAQYFNMTTWMWQEMSEDINEKVMGIFDEAYLMIDKKVPQSLVFLRNAAKRVRKYEAAIAIISHSVVDFLDPSVKMYGQALLDTPCYKILFGTDGQNLKETTSLYNLTDSEEELLLSKQQKHALMFIGSRRLHVKFDIPDYKWQYFGKAGGR